MARLYADEDFSHVVVAELRLVGHDVLTAQDAGQAHQQIPDPSVLAYAIGEGRAVITFNRWHFIRLHRRTSPHSGIIVCTRDDDAVALATRIDHAVRPLATLDNQLVRIVRGSKP